MITVRVKTNDSWEVIGKDRFSGVTAENVSLSSLPDGSDQASFDLKRDPGVAQPDLHPFTPVEIFDDNIKVWFGRLMEAPTTDYDDPVVSVVAKGAVTALDDDTYKRLYVHTRPGDWQDMRSYLYSNLKKLVVAWTVEAGTSGIKMALESGKTVANHKGCAVYFDAGYDGAIKEISLQHINTAMDAEAKLFASDELPITFTDGGGDYVHTIKDLSVEYDDDGNPENYFRTLTDPKRYVAIFIDPGAHTASADEWFQILSVKLFSDADYSDAGESDLTATQVIKDARDQVPSLISSSDEKIQQTEFILPDLAFTDLKSPGEVMRGVNAFHDWRLGVDVDGKVVFAPQDSYPPLEVGEWSGAQLNAASEYSGDEVYNVANVEAIGVDGQPVIITKTASDEQRGQLTTVTDPAMENATLTNENYWSTAPALIQYEDYWEATEAKSPWALYRFDHAGLGDGDTFPDEMGNADGVVRSGEYIATNGRITGQTQPHAITTTDDTNGGIEIPDAPQLRLNGTWAIECWIKQDSYYLYGFDTGLAYILSKGDASSGYVLSKLYGKGAFLGKWGKTWFTRDEKWHHIVAQVDSSEEFTIWYDGELLGGGPSGTWSGPLGTDYTESNPDHWNDDRDSSAYPLIINPYYYDGSGKTAIDSLAFYTDALTEDEIVSQYTNGASGFYATGGVGTWRRGKTWKNVKLKTGFTGTFVGGVRYRLAFNAYTDSGATGKFKFSIGSGSDRSQVVQTITDTSGTVELDWIPKQSVTGVTFQVESANDDMDAEKLSLTSFKLYKVVANVLDKRNVRRSKTIQVQSSVLTPETAEQIANIYLARYSKTPFKGSLTVNGFGSVRESLTGRPLRPAELLLYAGRMIRLNHKIDPDTGALGRDAYIASVSYDAETGTADVALDNTRGSFDALLARLALIGGVG